MPSTGLALAGCIAAGMAAVGHDHIVHALHDITNTTLFALGVPSPERVMANWRLAMAPAVLGLAYGGGGNEWDVPELRALRQLLEARVRSDARLPHLVAPVHGAFVYV